MWPGLNAGERGSAGQPRSGLLPASCRCSTIRSARPAECGSTGRRSDRVLPGVPRDGAHPSRRVPGMRSGSKRSPFERPHPDDGNGESQLAAASTIGVGLEAASSWPTSPARQCPHPFDGGGRGVSDWSARVALVNVCRSGSCPRKVRRPGGAAMTWGVDLGRSGELHRGGLGAPLVAVRAPVLFPWWVQAYANSVRRPCSGFPREALDRRRVRTGGPSDGGGARTAWGGFGVGITGIAGPTGSGEAVGTVFMPCGPGERVSASLRPGPDAQPGHDIRAACVPLRREAADGDGIPAKGLRIRTEKRTFALPKNSGTLHEPRSTPHEPHLPVDR